MLEPSASHVRGAPYTLTISLALTTEMRSRLFMKPPRRVKLATCQLQKAEPRSQPLVSSAPSPHRQLTRRRGDLKWVSRVAYIRGIWTMVSDAALAELWKDTDHTVSEVGERGSRAGEAGSILHILGEWDKERKGACESVPRILWIEPLAVFPPWCDALDPPLPLSPDVEVPGWRKLPRGCQAGCYCPDLGCHLSGPPTWGNEIVQHHFSH